MLEEFRAATQAYVEAYDAFIIEIQISKVLGREVDPAFRAELYRTWYALLRLAYKANGDQLT